MNSNKIDELMKSYTELEELIELRGFSDLDYKRLKRFRSKLESLIKQLEIDMEIDDYA